MIVEPPLLGPLRSPDTMPEAVTITADRDSRYDMAVVGRWLCQNGGFRIGIVGVYDGKSANGRDGRSWPNSVAHSEALT
jgi:hypothetical protein